MLRGKLMPLNKILGSQAKTQRWAFEMMPKAFRCSDKPIQVRNKGCILAKTTIRPNKTLHNN